MNWLIKIGFILLLVACKKTPNPSVQKGDLNTGYLILNEGLFQQNNASLTFYSEEELVEEQNFYYNVNGEMLGDVANDFTVYGGKIFIVLNNSNLITVLNARTGGLIQKIPMMDSSVGRSPRNVIANEGKIYVCSFDGSVARIDTQSLVIETLVDVGRNPDGMAIGNGKLYVSNSGGLDFPNYDSTVSVVDLNSFTEIKKIDVGLNPGQIVSDFEEDIYLIKRGDYSADPAEIIRIDAFSDTIVQVYSGFHFQSLYAVGQQIYFVYADAQGNSPKIGIIDAVTEQIIQTDLFDLSHVQTFYGFEVDLVHQEIFVMDAHNYASTGTVYVHEFDGSLKRQIETGYLPKKIIRFE